MFPRVDLFRIRAMFRVLQLFTTKVFERLHSRSSMNEIYIYMLMDLFETMRGVEGKFENDSSIFAIVVTHLL